MNPTFRTHLIASVGGGFVAMILALCFGHDVFMSLAVQLAVTAGVLFWIRGPLWFPKLFSNYTWAPYIVGIFLLPLVFMMELGPFGFLLALAEGPWRKLSTHFDATKGNLYVDLAYILLIGALIVHRLIAGF